MDNETAQTFFQSRLARRFIELKSRNPRYSLRAYARFLDQNPAAVSQILKGKRRVSKKLALGIAERLNLSVRDMHRLTALFDDEKKPKASNDTAASELSFGRRVLEEDLFDIIADWRYYAVLSLSETDDFRSDYEWIADRLNLSAHEVKMITDTLVAHELLECDQNGKITHTGQNVTASDGVRNLALRRRYESNFEHARTSIYAHTLEERDFAFITMAIDPEKIPEARRRIRRFINSLSEYLESGEKTEVYEFFTGLFPRSNLKR